MKVIKEQVQYYNYAFLYDFSMDLLEFCRFIKNKFGWKEFNFYEKSWRFNNISIIETIKNRYPETEVDESIQDDWKKYLLEKAQKDLIIEKANKIKRKTTTDLVIKGLKGKPYQFQLIGTEFLINNNGRAIINSDCGTGKSLQALSYIVHEKISKTLIICPCSVKFSWENEVKKWSSLKSFIINNKTDFTIDIFNENQVFVINYDILKKFFTQLTNFRFECLIIDECQYAKSIKSLRSKLTKQIAKKITKVILLTGTLMLSRPVELFNPLNILDPFVWNDWHYFTKKYCDGHDTYFGYDVSGSSNIDELKERISKYYIRHTKEEVLKDLPEKVFIDMPMELDNDSRFEYDLALSSFIEYLREVKEKNDIEIRKSLQAEKLVRLGELRRVATNGKIKIIEELIQNIIDTEQKCLVFSSYNEPLEKLKEKFGDSAVILTGKTPEFLRKGIVDAFQNNPKVKIFLSGFQSGGVGINLTASNNVIFCDLPWNPADMVQAYSRAHRIGNKADSINIYQVIARDTIDSKMKEILDRKQALIDKIFGGEKSSEEFYTNIINDLIKDLST